MRLKKNKIKFLSLFIIALLLLAACGGNSTDSSSDSSGEDEEGIKVGVLFSLSGPTAINEAGMADAALMAIEEINENGGVNGKKLIPIKEDYASDPSEAATKTQKLVMEDEVTAIVGGFTSATRQAMLPIIEESNTVLVYPPVYEGEEYSENIIYMGTVPNQQLEVIIPWILENIGESFYLVGSDYLYPVQINNQLKKLLEIHGGEVVGEDYVPIGHTEFSPILNDIRQKEPDVIFSTLISDSVTAFYTQYADYGFDPSKMPIASPTTNETELVGMANEVAEGHISVHNYFKTTDTPENEEFVSKYQEKFGEDKPISTIIESAYVSVHVLAKALEAAGEPYETEEILSEFVGLEFQAPQGKIVINESNHVSVTPRIGVINADGEYDEVYFSEELVTPEPWSKLIFPDHEEPWKK